MNNEERQALLNVLEVVASGRPPIIAAVNAIKAFTPKPKTKTVWVNFYRKGCNRYNIKEYNIEREAEEDVGLIPTVKIEVPIND